MTINPIFDNFNNIDEQRLHEDLLEEFVQTWGIDAFYLPRTSESSQGFDLLFGDDPTKKYSESYTLEMFIQSVDNFEGGEIFGKFGLEVRKQARFLLPKRAFAREVPLAIYPRPREGDLVWLHNFKALFEIKFVNEEHWFYDFGKNDFYGWSLIVEKFRYNDELIQTGVDEVDQTANTVGFVYNFNMANVANVVAGTYQANELVYQTSDNTPTGPQSATALVVTWNLPSGVLALKQINGLFLANANIFGQLSEADWMLQNYDFNNSINHPLSDNDDIETEANSVLNWTETNPFGDS
jgi:hypothetical protein